MSFALTTAQIEARTKTVTRRKGWLTLKPGDRLLPVLKCMGLKKGEKHTPIGDAVLEVVSVRRERLTQIFWEDRDSRYTLAEQPPNAATAREGFPRMTPSAFCDLYIKANGGTADQECTRIEFRYVEPSP